MKQSHFYALWLVVTTLVTAGSYFSGAYIVSCLISAAISIFILMPIYAKKNKNDEF